MKNTLFLVLFYFLLVSGCQESVKKDAQREPNAASDSNLPEIMVGVWEMQDENIHWGIKFEPDGSIKKIIHFLVGEVNLPEGGVSIAGPDPNTYAVFTMGPCVAEYDETTKILKVKIVLDYYEMQLPTGNLSGRIEDYLSGPVSTDGKTWNVEWRSLGWLEGASPPDMNDIVNFEKLTFKKIEIKK